MSMYRTSRLLTAFTMLALPAHAAFAANFEDALTSAYESNPRIKSARQQLESTDESVSQAASGFRPTIGLTYDTGRQRSDYTGVPTGNNSYTNETFRVEQPLFRGGGTFSALNSARQRVKAGEATLSATEQQVLLDATIAYMDVLSNSQILELSRNNESVLREQLRSTNTRFDVGEVTRTDVAQAQARLSDAKSAVISAEGDLLTAMASFERIVGHKPIGTLALPERLPEIPASMQEAIDLAHTMNPQLVAAVHNAKSARFDVRSNEAVLLPTVSLVGTMSHQEGVGEPATSTLDQDQIGFQVRIPLYQSGAEYSRVRAAKATARARDHDTTDTREAVDQEVTQSWEQVQTAVSVMSARNDEIKSNEVALEGVKQENEFGVRTLLDVLNAEQELFSARTALIRAQRDHIVAVYTLAFRLGKLTPAAIGLQTPTYDPKEHASDVAWQPIGF